MGGISHRKRSNNTFLYKNVSDDGKAIVFNDKFVPVGECVRLSENDLKSPAIKQFIERNRLALIVKDIKTDLDVEKFISFSDFSKILKVYQKKEIKLLIIREGGLGDILLTTPILPELKKIIPHIHITYATSNQYIELLIDNPCIDEVSVWQEINKKDYDYILNLSQEVENLPERTFLDRVSLFCKIVGVNPSLKLPFLSLSKDDIDWADRYLSKNNYKKDKKTIGICLEAVSILRSYPQTKFKQLAQKLIGNPEIQIILLGEKNIEEWSMTRVISSCGKTTILQVAALIKKCDLVIGGDNGLLHIAGTLGIPILGLFGSEPPELRLIQYKKWEAIYLKDRLSCVPCFSWKDNKRCSLKNGVAECMDLITPEMIYEKAMRMLGYDSFEFNIKDSKDKTEFIEQKGDKVVAFVTITGDYYSRYLAQRVRNSFFYFHPSLSFYIFSFNDEKQLLGNIITPPSRNVKDPTMLSLRFLAWLKERYDTVIRLDADVVITNVLDEFLKDDYDVAGSLNVPEINPNFENYLNLGVAAVRSKEFAKNWRDLSYDTDFIRKNNFNFYEQDVFNYIAHSKNYKLKIVDEKDCYYNETSREYWNKIEVIENKLFVNNRQIKALHWAGGGDLKFKVSHRSFNSPTRKFLNKVTKTTDFTDENL